MKYSRNLMTWISIFVVALLMALLFFVGKVKADDNFSLKFREENEEVEPIEQREIDKFIGYFENLVITPPRIIGHITVTEGNDKSRYYLLTPDGYMKFMIITKSYQFFPYMYGSLLSFTNDLDVNLRKCESAKYVHSQEISTLKKDKIELLEEKELTKRETNKKLWIFTSIGVAAGIIGGIIVGIGLN